MRRFILLFISIAIFALLLTACGSKEDAAAREETESIQIVATIFPEYDWVKQILGSNPANIQVTMLQRSGVDMHSYQPTPKDILKISSCDLLIYVGGESDEWIQDALVKEGNEDRIALKLLDVPDIQLREEEDAQPDEHVWLSLRNAASLCEAIEEAIAGIDPENRDVYAANLRAFQDQLRALDGEYAQVTASAPVKTLVFGDRFPFRYMTEDYGLTYYAAFDGCSAETEASFETIRFLAKKVDELGLPCVMTIDGSDRSVAETIIRSTKSKDQRILTLNSMQSVTEDDAKAGRSYLEIMRENRAVLREALAGNAD